MLELNALKLIVVLFLFVVLPIALMKYMVYKTIPVSRDVTRRPE
jgi:hypothetical protein